jgi:hypothetical protein
MTSQVDFHANIVFLRSETNLFKFNYIKSMSTKGFLKNAKYAQNINMSSLSINELNTLCCHTEGMRVYLHFIV